jgi:hypothetical protein
MKDGSRALCPTCGADSKKPDDAQIIADLKQQRDDLVAALGEIERKYRGWDASKMAYAALRKAGEL